MRTHDRPGFCAICGAKDPDVGSPCEIPKLASAHVRLAMGARRREILWSAREHTVYVAGRTLVIEAAVDHVDNVTLFIDADIARRE